MKEIVTAGQFLILTGIILPLLPNEPVTTLTAITPRQVWLALVVVCTFSYVSYLAQRYWAAAAGGLWMAALGGLYSSTATTVVLARQAKADPAIRRHAQAGITLATAIMYLRILAITAIFNMALARRLALPLIGLSAAGLVDLRAAILGLWQFGARSTGAARAGEARRQPQSAGAWRGDRYLRCCSSRPRSSRPGRPSDSACPAFIRSPRSSASPISIRSSSTWRKAD